MLTTLSENAGNHSSCIHSGSRRSMCKMVAYLHPARRLVTVLASPIFLFSSFSGFARWLAALVLACSGCRLGLGLPPESFLVAF